MGGAAITQAIWVTRNGATTTATLQELYSAYVQGTIGQYRIYYVDPESIQQSVQDSIKKPLVGTMPIIEVYDYGICQKVTVTSEDDLSVTLGATGALLDITTWDPVHVTANFPSNTRHYVTALSSLGGSPGDKVFVRKVTGYRMTGSCQIASVPTPNMIAASGFVIMS